MALALTADSVGLHLSDHDEGKVSCVDVARGRFEAAFVCGKNIQVLLVFFGQPGPTVSAGRVLTRVIACHYNELAAEREYRFYCCSFLIPHAGEPMPLASESVEPIRLVDFHSEPRLSWAEKLGFGQGEIANNLSWTMVGGFVLYYYTDVALLPVAALGTMLLLSRGLDAFVDPLIGLVMDRTRTRFGRARPYVLFGAFPFALLSVMVFTAPFHGPTAKLVYAYVTLLLLGALYSVVSIPYGALMPLMTKNSKEKVQLGSLRSIGTSVGAVAITTLTVPLVAKFGRGDASKGFLLTALLFSAIALVQYIIVFMVSKERYLTPAENEVRQPVSSSLNQLVHNGMFVVTAGFTTLHLVRIGCVLTATVYFALYVLHAPWTIPFLFGAMSAGSIVAALFAPAYFGRFGLRKGNAYALLFATAIYCFLPALQSRPIAFVVVYTAALLGAQICTTAVFVMVTNSADYHEFRFGSRNDGLIFSCLSLSTKIGIALGAAIVAYGLSLGHYDAKAVSATSVQVIRALYYVVPGILMLLQIAVVLFYRLDTKTTMMVNETAKRRAGA